jgi:hypothetical protein
VRAALVAGRIPAGREQMLDAVHRRFRPGDAVTASGSQLLRKSGCPFDELAGEARAVHRGDVGKTR